MERLGADHQGAGLPERLFLLVCQARPEVRIGKAFREGAARQRARARAGGIQCRAGIGLNKGGLHRRAAVH